MSQTNNPLEELLTGVVSNATSKGCPPKLAEALNWAVFPGGSRMRPRLCGAVAVACGGAPSLAIIPGGALELLHCASLVHDDLPCFDDAELRRGRASVQAAYGEQLAVLAGDALIVMAFEMLASRLTERPALAMQLTTVLARGVGAPYGIAAGQAWECESAIDVSAYHRAKTGALFAAATEAGAAVADADIDQWSPLGLRLGEAYQVADDILDAAGRCEDTGKPVGQDARLARPNYVHEQGLTKASRQLRSLVSAAIDAIPDCPGRADLCARIKIETDRMLPPHLANLAA